MLHDISFSVRRVGLPLTVRWTHLETTYSRSCLTVTLGKCFHFRVSLDDESRAVVSALPGLQNHADQRSVELWSADDLRQFILGEVCRQIVLTFGDITSAWLSVENSKRCHFKVDLAPAAIHLFGGDKARPKLWNSNSGGNKLNGSWEVRVYAEREVRASLPKQSALVFREQTLLSTLLCCTCLTMTVSFILDRCRWGCKSHVATGRPDS